MNGIYGAGVSSAFGGIIDPGYPGYGGYVGPPTYSMQTQTPGIRNGLYDMNSKLPGTMNQFGAATMSGTPAQSNFRGSPYPSTNFDDEMFGPYHGPYNARVAGQLDYIINDPRKTNDEIKALIENIRPDEDLPAENREGTPDGLKYPLVGSPLMIQLSGKISTDCS